jgi:hypothetical protein
LYRSSLCNSIGQVIVYGVVESFNSIWELVIVLDMITHCSVLPDAVMNMNKHKSKRRKNTTDCGEMIKNYLNVA